MNNDMKTTLLYSIAALTALTLLATACSQDDSLATDHADGAVPLQIISAGLGTPQVQTRAEATLLTTGSLGIFRTRGTDYKEEQKNKKYTYSAAKGWQPATAADSVFFFWNEADIHAYYPYNSAYTDRAAVPLTSGKYTGTVDDLTKHDSKDICYGSKTGLCATDTKAVLTLQHAMSLLRFNFSRLNYESSKCIITSIKITNSKLAATGTLNLTDGKVTAKTYATSPIECGSISVTVPAAGSINKDAFLLIPTDLTGSSTLFTFVVDGKTMTATVPAATLGALQAGKIHQLDFKIHAAAIVLNDVNIIDWTSKWEDGKEPDKDVPIATTDYIEIEGIKWALSNLEFHPEYYNYCFAKQSSDAGTLLEWNALTDESGTGNASAWTKTNDPCSRIEPKGVWETPNETHYTKLYESKHVSGTLNGTDGIWFGTDDVSEAIKTPQAYLFIPAQSGISYWTRTKSGTAARATSPAGQSFANQTVTTAYAVRCVRVPPGINVPKDQITLGGTTCTDSDKEALSKLRWAEGNLVTIGGLTDWATNTWDYGYYYQFNKFFDGTAGDPCTQLDPDNYGSGWRTPSSDELTALSRCTNKSLVSYNGKNGMWFMAPAPDGLFLPAAGNRSSGDGYVGTYGYYWGTTPSGSFNGYRLTFTSGYCNAYISSTTNGFAVRCVKFE